MRLCPLALTALLAATTGAAAQTPAPAPVKVTVTAPAPLAVFSSSVAVTPNAQTTPDLVVARLMSFDRNKDGRITGDELSERMQGIVTRGDRGGDGALDAEEIRRLAVAPTPVQVRSFGSLTGSGAYGFGDESGFSSRMQIEGAIDDLRLASDRRDQAVAIGTAFAAKREAESMADLMAAMTPLLSEEELRVFTLIAKQSAHLTGVSLVRAGAADKEVVLLPVLMAQMQRFQPNAKQPPEATDAIKKFKDRQRLGEADRAQLLAELRDTLTPDERDDLNAALARRPVVKNSSLSKRLDTFRAEIKVAAPSN